MIDLLDLPTPYVIGISSSLWNKIFTKKWNELYEDTVAFDVDTEFLNTKLDIIDKPEPITSALIQTLKDLHKKFEANHTNDSLNEQEFII